MQAQLRDLNVAISKDSIQNENLRNIKQTEIELRRQRDHQETELLATAEISQSDNYRWSENKTSVIKDQIKKIEDTKDHLVSAMDQRTRTNVRELLRAIETDIQNNNSAIKSLKNETNDLQAKHQNLDNQNSHLKSQVLKMNESFREL